MSKKFSNWDSVDFTKSLKQLSEELGFSISYIARKKKILAPYLVKKVPLDNYKRKYDFSNVNFQNTSDRDIMRDLDCCLYSVRWARIQNAPATVGLKIPSRKERKGKSLIKKIDYSKSNESICEDTGLKISTVKTLRRENAPETINRFTHKWEDVDWSKSSLEIKKEKGIKEMSQVSRARKRYAPETLS